jgi:tRNA-specific 2-thiouridylase
MSAPVLVAMSGGVDSSVAAALLVEQGYDVTGVTLKLWGGETGSGCCGVDDVEDARRVAAQLDIPHYVFNFADDFDARVVAPYVDAYAGGRTPNPCVECNRTMKFGRLLDRAAAMGFERIATGHHARVERTADGRFRLLRGRDRAKDQSYVLYMLTQRELARVSLPVGTLTKAEVRAHAARLGLRTADKPESMDVCFIARTDDRERFLGTRVSARPGPVVDVEGTILGQHDGVAGFTVGQRRGLGIATGERRYVVDVDAPTATVTIGHRDDLLRDDVRVEGISFVDQTPGNGVLFAQVRAHGTAVAARLHGDRVRFEEPQPRVAPGQVVALYDGDVMIGGGIAA